jgi:SAM-dependent methyltransferase
MPEAGWSRRHSCHSRPAGPDCGTVGPMAYECFAAFYDEVMDDPGPRAARVVETVERYRAGPASLLELGCGTGSMLARLPDIGSITGLDRSPEMAAFSLGRRFDVVICVFDSLNHLLSFDAWLATFDAVASHLAEDGLFVFDINTLGELQRLGEDPPAVYDFDGGVAIIDVTFAHDGADSGMSQWDVRIFEQLGSYRYRLHREQIGELGVRLSQVTSAAEGRFDLLEVTDERGGSADDGSVKAHFVLRRRPGTARRPG